MHCAAWADTALTTFLKFLRAITLVCMAALATACTSMDGFGPPPGNPEPAVVKVPPPSERPLQEPLNPNEFVLDSPDQSIVGEPQIIFTKAENTFADLAREYGLGYDELVQANPDIDPWLPGDDTPVILPTQFVLPDGPREGIVLNIASKRLFYFPKAEEGQPQTVMTYPIGIGRVGWQTPLGSSAVVSKARDPHWYVPASVRKEHAEEGDPLPAVVPPGPDNPLGRHVLKLDIPGYLIHGTNQPYGVGMRVSHGCVRLYPENIEFLYELVGVGETVTIINEPFLAGWKDGHLYFEVHAPLEDDSVSLEMRLVRALEKIENLAGERDAVFDLDTLRVAAKEALGVPVILNGGVNDTLMARSRVVTNTFEPDPNLPSLMEVRELLDAPAEKTAQEKEAPAADASAVND